MSCKLFVFSAVISVWPLKAYSLAVDSPPATTLAAAATSVNRQALADAPPFPRTWIPLASTFELDPDRPTPLKFLNQDYITYRDNNEQWVVMDDACPHRLAPLSEGRIDREKNRIECSYHGWSFDSTGACQRIPQLGCGDDASSSDLGSSSGSSATLRTALASPRSCVASYPTQVHKSILFAWLWPEDPLRVILGSSSSGVDFAATPEGMLDGAANHTTTYTRDLPYSWEILVENLIGKKNV
jgi:pheophorbide a oxygenase